MGGAESATSTGRRAIPSVPLAVVVGCMLAGAIYAYAVGDDTNWDWRNYHASNVWATINHRYDIDVVPAGFQTYFNPLIYYPIYMLHRLTPLWAGLIAGAVHGLNLAAIYSLTRALLGNAANAACLAASVLLAAYGPITLSEVGTSFADILLSLPIIVALILGISSDEPRPKYYVLAGVLIGASVALKLTNFVFAFGLLGAAIAATRPLAALAYSYPPILSIGSSYRTTGATGWPIRSTGWSATTAALNMRFATPALRWRSFSSPRPSASACFGAPLSSPAGMSSSSSSSPSPTQPG